LVPVGYADGYSREFSNEGVMLLHGSVAPVVGRISMDLTTIDLSQVPMASITYRLMKTNETALPINDTVRLARTLRFKNSVVYAYLVAEFRNINAFAA
jgi:alanine racemase